MADDIDDIKTSFQSVFGQRTTGICTRLLSLWKSLEFNNFTYQEGTYPAGHGKKHIKKVLQNLCNILLAYQGKDGLTDRQKELLFAAGMIHDIGMIGMRPLGAYGNASSHMRAMHAYKDIIAESAEPALRGAQFSPEQIDLIIKIAATHASDEVSGSVKQKSTELKERYKKIGLGYIYPCAILLQAADFFDVGKDRLAGDVTTQAWKPDQIKHYKKHETVNVKIDHQNKKINIYLSENDVILVKGKPITINPIERIKILDCINYQAEEIVHAMSL